MDIATVQHNAPNEVSFAKDAAPAQGGGVPAQLQQYLQQKITAGMGPGVVVSPYDKPQFALSEDGKTAYAFQRATKDGKECVIIASKFFDASGGTSTGVESLKTIGMDKIGLYLQKYPVTPMPTF